MSKPKQRQLTDAEMTEVTKECQTCTSLGAPECRQCMKDKIERRGFDL